MGQIGKIINGKFVPFADLGGGKTILTPNKAVVSGTDGTLQASEVTAQEVGFLTGLTRNVQEQMDLFDSYSNVARANDTDFNEFARKSAVNGKIIPFLTARMKNAPFSSDTIALGMFFRKIIFYGYICDLF